MGFRGNIDPLAVVKQEIKYSDDTNNCIDTIINWGQSLTDFIAQDSANKLDSKEQLVNNIPLFDFFKETLTPLLKKSKWNRLRKKLGKQLSICGKVGVAMELIDGKPILTLSKYLNHKMIGYKLVEYWGTTDQLYTFDGNNYPLNMHYFKDPLTGKVIKSWEYEQTKGGFISVGNVEIPYSEIPVHLFVNNEDEVGDIANTNMWNSINALDHLSNLLVAEQDLTKTSFVRNKTSGSIQKLDTMMKNLIKNRSVEGTDYDNQLQSILSPLISGSDSNVIMQSTLNFIEDKILKYTFSFRDTDGTGTNKHNAEIASFNSRAIEYLTNKKEIREDDYKDFYEMLLRLTDQSTEEFEVEVLLSKSITNLMDSADQVKLIKAQGNVQAQVQEKDSNEGSTKKTEKVKE